MAIFNSLGSNYNLNFVLRALFAGDKKEFHDELEDFLKTKYGGKVILTYKGREAIELALNCADLPKSVKVGVTGFTCWAVYNAVVRAGHKVEYLDIGKDLNFSPETLRKHLKTNPKIKVLIIQNTLGNPCQIEEIVKICRENEILLIEDLAHSVGTKYRSGLEAGTLGDFVVLSFSQDKMVDGISGGALIIAKQLHKPEGRSIIRNKKYQNFSTPNLNELESRRQVKDRLYPLFTFLIRKTYKSGFGKILHFFLKVSNLLSKSVDDQNLTTHKLPNWYCRLVKIAFENLERDLYHRRKISSIYAQTLDHKVFKKEITEKISLSSCLRFPIFVKNRNSLLSHLDRKNIYVSDIWYDAPIAPYRFLKKTTYNNQCPQAEKISREILNLPTHKNVSENEAQTIAWEINQWLKLQ